MLAGGSANANSLTTGYFHVVLTRAPRTRQRAGLGKPRVCSTILLFCCQRTDLAQEDRRSRPEHLSAEIGMVSITAHLGTGARLASRHDVYAIPPHGRTFHQITSSMAVRRTAAFFAPQ